MNRTKEEWASWLPFEHSEIIAQQDIAELWAQVEAFGDVVALALPYVECAEDDPCYKPGAVRKIVEKMRAVIEQLEQTK